MIQPRPLAQRKRVACDVVPVADHALGDVAPALTALLRDAVDAGAALGFLPPLGDDECLRYWLSLRTGLRGSERVLLVAHVWGRLAGSGRLMLPRWPNARQRAEVQKLIVGQGFQRRGVGAALMVALDHVAKASGRSLVILGNRGSEAPQRFFQHLDYQLAGVLPDAVAGTAGGSCDGAVLFRRPAG